MLVKGATGAELGSMITSPYKKMDWLQFIEWSWQIRILNLYFGLAIEVCLQIMQQKRWTFKY